MMWRQIANRFRDYDHHLLFAGMNEPEVGGDNSHDEEGEAAALAKYQQTFVNTVRQTGGNNNTRILVVQAPLTNIGLAAKYNIIPTDITPSALMLEVHFYSPFEFCQLEEDKEWGYRAFYWGEGNYVDGSKHNSTWGGEDLIQKEMRQMKNKYSSKGYPVVLGEFGSLWRDIPQGENQDVPFVCGTRRYASTPFATALFLSSGTPTSADIQAALSLTVRTSASTTSLHTMA